MTLPIELENETDLLKELSERDELYKSCLLNKIKWLASKKEISFIGEDSIDLGKKPQYEDAEFDFHLAMNTIQNKYLEWVDKAESIFGNKPYFKILRAIKIDFSLISNKTLGYASINFKTWNISIQINIEAYFYSKESSAHILNETLPHELCHLIEAFQNGKMSHSPQWKRYFKALTGNDAKAKSRVVFVSSLAKKRKKTVYFYHVFNGDLEKTIDISPQMHKKIQAGARYIFEDPCTGKDFKISKDFFRKKQVIYA